MLQAVQNYFSNLFSEEQRVLEQNQITKCSHLEASDGQYDCEGIPFLINFTINLIVYCPSYRI